MDSTAVTVLDGSPSEEPAKDTKAPPPKPTLLRRVKAAVKRIPYKPVDIADAINARTHRDWYLPAIALFIVCFLSVVVIPVFMVFKATGEAASSDSSKVKYCAIQATYNQATCDAVLRVMPNGDRSEIDTPGLIHFSTSVVSVDPSTSTMKVRTRLKATPSSRLLWQFARWIVPGRWLRGAVACANRPTLFHAIPGVDRCAFYA